MTSSSTTPPETNPASNPGTFLLPWITRGLEGFWLIAIIAVPLVFLGQKYAISEAEIANVEVPKVALIRTLAALMALFWLAEWAIKSQRFQGPLQPISLGSLAANLSPSKLFSSLRNSLRVHPTRWFLLSAGLFFGSTFLSTVLSGSVTTSMWGEIPGQDGYSAYTMASYGILFGVIATHLRSREQLGRLLGTVVLMGFLVGLYGIFQHFGHDFLGVTEITGGGSARVTIFMGNTIFAAAVLSMTVPVTLVVAAITLHDTSWTDRLPLAKLERWVTDSILTSVWAFILSVQLLGLMFTFSRGPWGGAVMALAAFLLLVAISLGPRALVRTGLVLGLAGVLTAAFLHQQGSVSVTGLGPWLGFVLALLGLGAAAATQYLIVRYKRAVVLVMSVAVAVAIVGAAVIGPSVISGRGGGESTVSSSAANEIGDQLTSIKTDVLGGRGTHWKVSWELIKDRPWFEFDNLHLSWLRPLIGYGPDLFRYTYLLKSPPDTVRFFPLEPDHAHNFFIHQTVEQGIIGGLTSLALFVSVFWVAAHHLLRRRDSGNPLYRLLLFGLAAVLLGRFLEMMVGVARVSDVTVLWALFGLFAVLWRFDDGHEAESVPAVAQNLSRRDRRRSRRAAAQPSFSTGLIIRLAIMAWLIGGIGVITWQKSINSVRAAVAEGQALEHFRAGDLEATLEKLDKAIALAPGVPSYYNNRAQIFFYYQVQPDVFSEPGCRQQTELPYLACLGLKSLESDLDSIDQQPFYYRSRIAAGNAAFNLQLHESAIDHYSKAVSMVPNAWRVRNDLAESQIDAGLYDAALNNLERSLDTTGDTDESTSARYLQGRALREFGRLDEATQTLKMGMALNYVSESAKASLDLIREIDTEQGVALDVGYFDGLINEAAEDPIAYYQRGLALLSLGEFETANLNFEKSYSLGLTLDEVRAVRGYTRFKMGMIAEAGRGLLGAASDAPQDALIQAYVGDYQLLLGFHAQALNDLQTANTLDPDLDLAKLVRAKVFASLGMKDSLNEALESLSDSKLPTAQDYVDRGEIYAYVGDYDRAFSDFEEAIRINPRPARFYHARGQVHGLTGDFVSAISDLDNAIEREMLSAKYLITRGIIYEIMGEFELADADYEMGEPLSSNLRRPQPDEPNELFLEVFPVALSSEAEAKLIVDLDAEREAIRASGG